MNNAELFFIRLIGKRNNSAIISLMLESSRNVVCNST